MTVLPDNRPTFPAEFLLLRLPRGTKRWWTVYTPHNDSLVSGWCSLNRGKSGDPGSPCAECQGVEIISLWALARGVQKPLKSPPNSILSKHQINGKHQFLYIFGLCCQLSADKGVYGWRVTKYMDITWWLETHVMIFSKIPHSMNKLVYFQQDTTFYEQVCLFGLALYNLKGTLKQAHPWPYRVQQKSRLKRNVPLKKRFLLPLQFQSTLQLMVVSLTVAMAARSTPRIHKRSFRRHHPVLHVIRLIVSLMHFLYASHHTGCTCAQTHHFVLISHPI